MKMRLAVSAVFLALAACQSAAPFKNMTMVPVGTEDCKALCLVHGPWEEGDSLWFVDGENELCRTKFPQEFSGLHWIILSPDHERVALMSGCEGCFDLSVYRVCDGLGPSCNDEDWAKPICSIGEYRYYPGDVRWNGNHELRFSAEWLFPAPPEDSWEECPLRQWKWDITSGRIEEVR